MARVHGGAVRANERREILAGKTVRIIEGAAAHAIEQHVGKMMDAGRLIGGLLQPIGGGDTATQAAAVGRETLAQGMFEGNRVLQLVPETHERWMIEPGVGDCEPAVRMAGGDGCAVDHEVGAEFATDLALRVDKFSATERRYLSLRQEDDGMSVADRPGASGAQGFAGFSPVGNRRIEREDAEGFFVHAFMAHIGFREIAEAAEGFLINTRRKQLVPAVEVSHLDGNVIVEALDQAFTDESVRLAGAKAPTESQAEVVVNFLEDHAGAVDVLVKMAVNAINTPARLPGFPQRPALACANEQDRQRAAGVRMPQNLVDGLVGEERVVGIDAPGGEGRVAADEQPVIAVADHAHQKGS